MPHAVARTRPRPRSCAAIPLGPLHGVPMSIKDLLITKGVRTMRGSPIYEQFIPAEDAPAVEKLKSAGALMLGKTTTPEFGYKGMTDSPVTGISRNPWNLERTPGGSSGGAAAAVAAGMGPLAVGTDGGGSIRIPASFCGIFGMKASFGRVAAYPPSAVALVSHTGPMTRTVRDAALMLNVIAGPDERDLGSLPADGTDYLAACDGDLKGLRVAYSANLGYAPVDPEVALVQCRRARLRERIGLPRGSGRSRFRKSGQVLQHDLGRRPGSYLRPQLEAWQSRMDPGLVAMVKEVDNLTAADYGSALSQRLALWDVTRKFFDKYDLLLTPTMPMPAFGVDAMPTEIAGQKTEGLGWTPFTFPFNLTGQPAATVPCGFSAGGLPVGLQIVGARYADTLVLRAAAAFEAARPWAGEAASQL